MGRNRAQIWQYSVFVNLLKWYLKSFQKIINVKFNEDFTYFNQFENKLKLTCIQLLLTFYAMTKNLKYIIWDILVIFYI